MVGMAAVLAGSVRAPLTAILLLFELTRDYRIVLPLMAAVGLSAWLVERWRPAATQEANRQPLGLNVEKNTDPETLKRVTVSEVMCHQPLLLSSTVSVLEAGKRLMDYPAYTALVMDQTEQLLGIVTLNDIGRAITLGGEQPPMGLHPDALSEQTVGQICTTELLVAYENEPIVDAMTRMATRNLHQLPVVSRGNPQRVLGLLTREAIDLAKRMAATREAMQHYTSRLTALSETAAAELPLALPLRLKTENPGLSTREPELDHRLENKEFISRN